jgi:hypothetical protein
MIHAQELHAERARLECLTRSDLNILRFLERRTFLKTAADKPQRKARSVYRRGDFLKEERESSYMILMPVGYDNALHFVFVAYNVFIIIDYIVNAGHL